MPHKPKSNWGTAGVLDRELLVNAHVSQHCEPEDIHVGPFRCDECKKYSSFKEQGEPEMPGGICFKRSLILKGDEKSCSEIGFKEPAFDPDKIRQSMSGF